MSQAGRSRQRANAFARSAYRSKLNAEREANYANGMEVGRGFAEATNAVDIAWLEDLQRRSVFEAGKAKCQRSLDWLRADSQRCLIPTFRADFERMERAIKMSEQGKVVERGRGRRLPHYIAREKTPRPAWMDDPSLLPKKPPGKAA